MMVKFCVVILKEAVLKAIFNRRVRKVGAKHAKLKPCHFVLCDLCVIPIIIGTLGSLRFLDLTFQTASKMNLFALLNIQLAMKGFFKELASVREVIVP